MNEDWICLKSHTFPMRGKQFLFPFHFLMQEFGKKIFYNASQYPDIAFRDLKTVVEVHYPELADAMPVSLSFDLARSLVSLVLTHPSLPEWKQGDKVEWVCIHDRYPFPQEAQPQEATP